MPQGDAPRRGDRAGRAQAEPQAAETAAPAPVTPSPARPSRRRGRLGLALVLSLILIAAGTVFGALALTGRTVAVPPRLVEMVEARLNASLAQPGTGSGSGGVPADGSLRIGGIEVLVDDDYVPRIRLRGVEVYGRSGAPVALLPELRASLDGPALLRGRLQPLSLRISGAQATVRRGPDGALDLIFLQDAQGGRRIGSLPELLDMVEAVFAQPTLAGIARIDVDALGIIFDDQRAGRRWTVSNGSLSFRQDRTSLNAWLGFELAGEGGAPASAELTVSSDKASPEARVEARVSGVRAEDLAVQAPALAWLSVLEAPISGEFASGVDAGGRVARLDGELTIGRGAVKPMEGVRPVTFDGATLDFAYDPASERLDFPAFRIEGPALRMAGSGTAWLRGTEAGLPTGLVAQVAVGDLRADPLGLFERPAEFRQGAVDLKLDFDPFRLTVGQFVLVDPDGRRLSAEGGATARPEGWQMALDVTMDRIAHDRMIALWPVGLVPRTREWIAENVTTGELHDMRAAVRLDPGQEPKLSLSYAFRGAEVRILKTLPPVQDGVGRASIYDRTHVLLVEAGHVTAPDGGRIDMAGSVMTVPDITQKPAPLEFTLRTRSSIPAALSLLDQPPFELMRRAGKDTDIAQGEARAVARLKMTLAPRISPEDVSYDVTARLTGVQSDRIVPGHEIRAEALDLRATNEGLAISGPATVSGVPVVAEWTQGFGPEARGRSQVTGQVELSQRALDAFRIALPPGSVSGSGWGDITIDLTPDDPPALSLRSDLRGVGLAIPEIGWSKGEGAGGLLEVEASLGSPPRVDRLRVEGAGLTAEGSVTLAPEGTLQAVRLPRASVGGWFDGGVELRGRGAGRSPAVVITGGRADLRRADFGSGGGGSGGEAVPISVALDRLAVSDTLALTGLRGDFTTAGGFNGSFTGSVNGDGSAVLRGEVAPARGGGGRSAVRLRSDNAGRVLRAAGIFSRAGDGDLDVVLTPRGQAKGEYDGTFRAQNLRVRDAPVLAALLSAVSVVGLLEQLGGEGILFNTVDGRFRLTPDRVEISQAAAMGASLGVSMQGVYGFASKRLELRGVVSPVYLVNALGQLVSRRGEGLFGFNYTISGTSDVPQVSVNPLSILTPGMFREIFRAPPPEIRQ